MGCPTVKNQTQQNPLLLYFPPLFPYPVSFSNIRIMKSSSSCFFQKSNTKYMDVWVKALLPNGHQKTKLKRFQDLSPPTFILLNYLN